MILLKYLKTLKILFVEMLFGEIDHKHPWNQEPLNLKI